MTADPQFSIIYNNKVLCETKKKKRKKIKREKENLDRKKNAVKGKEA